MGKSRSPRQAVRAGLTLVTEDRKAQGLVLNQSVAANARLVLDAVLPRASRQRTPSSSENARSRMSRSPFGRKRASVGRQRTLRRSIQCSAGTT